MNLHVNKIILPEFLLKHKNINLSDIHAHYGLAWEPLINYPKSPLRATKYAKERIILHEIWKKHIYLTEHIFGLEN